MPGKTNEERSRSTRAALLAEGRRSFHTNGYAGTSAESIVEAAGLTRGALYHHFDGKKGLFAEVVAGLMAEVAEETDRAANAEEDLWKGFVAGCHTWLAVSTNPKVQRILLLEAPAVLGWADFRKLDEVNGTRSLKEGLDALAEAGILQSTSTDALAHALGGAFNELALWVAHSRRSKKALRTAIETLDGLVDSIRT